MKKYNEYKIQSGIPMPVKKASSRQFPLGKMKVGESFFVPTEQAESSIVRCACTNFRTKNQGYFFTVHKEHGGARVWRV